VNAQSCRTPETALGRYRELDHHGQHPARSGRSRFRNDRLEAAVRDLR
jgi:hypothetical protein